mmetsp:Transcript_15827/g.36689  ORF Transcript_15827/g.36689 Transcript_15827/m.36689 type:complete len:162 (+) Transcript_15827:1036-1521(+)
MPIGEEASSGTVGSCRGSHAATESGLGPVWWQSTKGAGAPGKTPAADFTSAGSLGGGGGGGGRKVLVQPGARAPVPASKAGGRGASAGKGSRNKSSAKNGGRAGGIVKPTPRAPVQTFGSKTANVAAQAAAGNSSPRGGRSGGGGKAANVGKVGKVRGGRQ